MHLSTLEKTADGVALAPVPRLLLRPIEAAAALALSERKLSELTVCGAIASVGIGSARRYSITALQAFIEATETPAAEEHVTRGVA